MVVTAVISVNSLTYTFFSVLLWRLVCSHVFLMSSPPGFTPQRFLIVCFYIFSLTAVPLKCFLASSLSPEMLHRKINPKPPTRQPIQKICIAGGLLDHCKLQTLGSGSRICHWVVNQMLHPYLNIRSMTSFIKHGILPIEVFRAMQQQIWKNQRAIATLHTSSVQKLSSLFHIQTASHPCCQWLWQNDAWGASSEDCALGTPQLDFGFHKASPLFTLTKCAGYWPGKSGQDGLSCKERGGWWCMGSFWDLSWNCCWRCLAIPLPARPAFFLSLTPLSISVPQSRLHCHPI